MNAKLRNLLKKQGPIYLGPLVLLLVGLSVIGLTVKLYYQDSVNLPETSLLVANAIITLTATLFGIFVPLQINNNREKSKDRRTLAFTLGLLWNELRSNKYTLQEIELNFSFSKMLKAPSFPLAIEGVANKFIAIEQVGKMLVKDSFISSQSSGAITTFDTDQLLNDIQMAYEDVATFQLRMAVVAKDIEIRQNLFTKTRPSFVVSQITEKDVLKQLEDKLNVCFSALRKSLMSVESAITTVDTKLTSMGLKVEELEEYINQE